MSADVIDIKWDAPGWRESASHWVAEQLGRHGRRVTGPVQERVRPWSLVWRVPTGDGDAWFKANSDGTRYEAGVLAALSRLAPGRVPDPLAVDAGRGWSLLPDGGPTLRDVLAVEPDPGRWERILPVYADLQRASAAHAGELLALGLPDHRPEALPGLFTGLLGDSDALLLGRDGGLTPEFLARLRAHADRYARDCRRLADLGVEPTVQHDDLHDGNVFVAADGPRFFDWGDASLAHPFGTLLVTLRSVAHAFELPAGDPVLLRMRDAYLEAWTDRHDRAVLREAAALATTVTTVSRSLSWRRALPPADPARAEYAAAVPGWLEELFAPAPL
ncbi:aminoglycoside phosphotransferase family protein [Micromonospora sp. WMMD975]|uniref:phosphotransferase family protein n=1 Tax=Micromonospora sp. WMMD975 TaxID=3016087 RepID=UPI00249B57AD|nr:aminoglycoside phosphotransferase family protein [Micromonospora sp. WMMD975]WFE34382.1 aminoglycoside phosphotransferase family protein [Micromonospora sp. WMMD975]